jgi:pyruvate kinase
MRDRFRRTKIVATLGPASSEPGVLRRLVEAGVDVFRLNFSHGDYAEKANAIHLVREIRSALGKPVAILQDLQGPKIRVGPLRPQEVLLHEGQRLLVYGDGRVGDEGAISVTYDDLSKDVRPGNLIFIDDGLIELRVLDVVGDAVETQVVIGGHVRTREGVNLPDVNLNRPCLTEKDEADLRFGLETGVDLVALSFVRKAEDALVVRDIFRHYGVNPPLIAKVEREEAVNDIAAVTRAFDGVMVARGDLGVNLRPEKVPTAQKAIIREAISQGKPVITATQMLESMTFNSVPTRAEASDVANAVYDGTDAVMLSGETAIGQYPVETVRTMDRIVREAEAQDLGPITMPRFEASTMVAFCSAAVRLAEEVDAAAIAALTRTGENAQILSALRPDLPIVALCEDQSLVYALSIRGAIIPTHIDRPGAIEDASATVRREILLNKLLPEGSQVVVVGV